MRNQESGTKKRPPRSRRTSDRDSGSPQEPADQEAKAELPLEVRVLAVGGFRKGVLLALLLLLPGLSLVLDLLAEEAMAQSLSFVEVLATVAAFAGFPSLLVMGGIGRNLARSAHRGPRHNALRGAGLGGLAGAGLLLLGAIPVGAVPDAPARLASLVLAGVGSGASTGAVLGLWLSRRDKSTGPDRASEKAC